MNLKIAGSFFSNSLLGDVALYKTGSDPITHFYIFSMVAEMASTPTPKLAFYAHRLPLCELRHNQLALTARHMW